MAVAQMRQAAGQAAGLYWEGEAALADHLIALPQYLREVEFTEHQDSIARSEAETAHTEQTQLAEDGY